MIGCAQNNNTDGSKEDIPPVVDPSEPSDPTEPTEPTDPDNPEDPTDPEEPVDPVDPSEPSDPTEPTDPVDPGTDPSEEGPIEDDYRVKSITLSDKEIRVNVGQRHSSILVNYHPDLSDLTDEEKEVKWSTLDESVATVDQYGRVRGVSDGTTYVVCSTVLGNRHARCLVIVGNATVRYEYQMVEDLSILSNNDTIVIACPEQGVVASEDSSQSKLHSSSTTFSSDCKKITSLGEGAAEFYIGEGKSESPKSWTLEIGESGNEKYFAGFNENRVGFVNKVGNIDWVFSFLDGHLYMETLNDVRGWMMYNHDHNWFTLYDYDEELESKPKSLDYVSIYRLTTVL